MKQNDETTEMAVRSFVTTMLLVLACVAARGLSACHVTPLPVPNRQDWEPAPIDPYEPTGVARDAGGDR